MSDQEPFLARWSRRKREGDKGEPSGRPAQDLAATQPPAEQIAGEEAAAPQDAEFDLSKLPSLDSITAETDIRDFLRPGVPSDLSRAALRRAWVTDPAIRDFVNLQENSWDFNAPGGMHGFGPLEPTDNLRKLLAQAIGAPDPDEPPVAESSTAVAEPSAEQVQTPAIGAAPPASDEITTALAESSDATSDVAPEPNANDAMQQNDSKNFATQRKKSGSALPT